MSLTRAENDSFGLLVWRSLMHRLDAGTLGGDSINRPFLAWDPKLFTLLTELAEANRNQRNACGVILADRDKVEMDAEIANVLDGGFGGRVRGSGSGRVRGSVGVWRGWL